MVSKRHQRQTNGKACKMSPMNTTNVTLKTQNEIGGCRTQHEANMKRDFHLEIYTSKSLLVIIIN